MLILFHFTFVVHPPGMDRYLQRCTFFDVFEPRFSHSKTFFTMDKTLSLLKSKKFWTLVAAIVAALTAFFTASCSAQAKVQRHGVHIDTVRVDYIIKSRNIQTSWIIPNESTPLFDRCSRVASLTPLRETLFSFNLNSRTSIVEDFTKSLPSVANLALTSPCPKSLFSVNSKPMYFSNSNASKSSKPFSAVMLTSSLLFSASFIRRSRRGGRRGGKRPKGTKSIPLGGQHL